MTISQAQRVGTSRGLTTWMLATIIIGVLIPFGGFAVLLVSRLPRFAARRPSWIALLVVATVILAIQIIGLQGSWISPVISGDPAQVVAP